MQSDKPSNSCWIYLDHLYIIEKGKVQEQNPLEHLFELPEYLRYDHQLKRIVSCFLGLMQTIHLQFILHQNSLVS